MTEDEAKSKWCPFASSRVVRWDMESDLVVNAIYMLKGQQNPSTFCLASACMAWRETKAPQPGEPTPTGIPLGAIRPLTVAEGFCGLAGAAQ